MKIVLNLLLCFIFTTNTTGFGAARRSELPATACAFCRAPADKSYSHPACFESVITFAVSNMLGKPIYSRGKTGPDYGDEDKGIISRLTRNTLDQKTRDFQPEPIRGFMTDPETVERILPDRDKQAYIYLGALTTEDQREIVHYWRPGSQFPTTETKALRLFSPKYHPIERSSMRGMVDFEEVIEEDRTSTKERDNRVAQQNNEHIRRFIKKHQLVGPETGKLLYGHPRGTTVSYREPRVFAPVERTMAGAAAGAGGDSASAYIDDVIV